MNKGISLRSQSNLRCRRNRSTCETVIINCGGKDSSRSTDLWRAVYGESRTYGSDGSES